MEKKPGQEESTPKEKDQSKKTTYVVPSTLFSAMDRYVTLPVLAKEYKISEEILLERIAQKKLEATRLGKTWLVRRDHFEQFLELYKQEKALDNYRASIQAKRKKVEKAEASLKQAKEDLKRLNAMQIKAPKEINPDLENNGLYGWMIKELSVLIPDERKRGVFIDFSQGKKVKDIAAVWDVSETVVRNEYKEAMEIINRKFGFLQRYRQLMSEVYLEMRKQELTIQLFQNQIFHLLEMLTLQQLAREPDWSKKPTAIVNMLCVSLGKLGFEGAHTLGFRRKGIDSLEDLMWHIKNHGFDSLLRLERVGKETMKQLRRKLIDLGIINGEGEVIFFKDKE